MTPQKESASARKKKDVLDHIEDFIEKNIENNLRKGFDEVEKFVKNELLEEGANGSGPLSYIRAYMKDKHVAAFHPSSQFVIDRVLKMINWKTTRTIVEYGPAEGVITKQLLERLPVNGTLVAIELNPKFAATLSRIRDSRLHVVHGSVLEMDKILASLSIDSADAIISGIPFSLLKPIQRHQLLHKTEEHLNPGGRFIAYQFTAHLIPLLKYHFEDVDVQFEIRNFPPHFVFTGYKGT